MFVYIYPISMPTQTASWPSYKWQKPLINWDLYIRSVEYVIFSVSIRTHTNKKHTTITRIRASTHTCSNLHTAHSDDILERFRHLLPRRVNPQRFRPFRLVAQERRYLHLSEREGKRERERVRGRGTRIWVSERGRESRQRKGDRENENQIPPVKVSLAFSFSLSPCRQWQPMTVTLAVTANDSSPGKV